MTQTRPGTLYIVSTPIGNLKDITLRALDILREADLIAAEDTRHTHILLDQYGIKKPMVSFFEHNQLRRVEQLMQMLREGKRVALVSDAGTPGISDPGFTIIREAVRQGIVVCALPGPSALVTALVVSGKPTNRFFFEGFLSPKTCARKKRIAEIMAFGVSVIVYESPHRLLKTLRDIHEVCGDIDIVVARELTKQFEEIIRQPVSQVIASFTRRPVRGEFVIIL